MRERTVSSLIVLAVSLVATTLPLAAAKKPLDIKLAWKPTSTIADLKLGAIDLTPFDKAKIAVRTLADKRAEPTKVGENREDEDKGKILPVTCADDAAAFLTQRLQDFLRSQGLPLAAEGEKANVVLSGELQEFFVTETNTYQASVRLKLTVSDAKGKTTWTGMAPGSAERFGRSYKADNYLEALSDAALEAFAQAMRSGDFLAALAGRKR